ncbi:hypothetical protein DYB30_009681 [Aphanomyces astaci]|uniref:PDEase domain-containing protein n=1 Tax=Aphanomyces astaci TaxID=112090 RepID=A0A397CWI6_APHAT|nr:hypothetical protein DYB30_009681 [Aphanomyces astaci]
MLPSPVSVAVSSEEIVPSVPGPMPPDSPDAKHRMLGGRGSALNILIGVDMEALVKKELAKISTWNFNVLEHSSQVPVQSIPQWYERSIISTCQQRALISIWGGLVAEHAADVMQCVHHFLTLGGLGTIISKRGRFAALVAAACHDVVHDT